MWQDCDESHRFAVDRLLIRPTHGHQAGAGDNKRTNHFQGIPKQEPVTRRVTLVAAAHSLPINTPDRRFPSSQSPEESSRSSCSVGEVWGAEGPLLLLLQGNPLLAVHALIRVSVVGCTKSGPRRPKQIPRSSQESMIN